MDQGAGQENNDPDQVSGKTADNSSDEPSRFSELVHSLDRGRNEPLGVSATRLSSSANRHLLPDEDKFMVKHMGRFIIITHIQSRVRTRIPCEGVFEYEDNLLYCNDEYYELKFDNGRILLEPIPEYGNTVCVSTPSTLVDTVAAEKTRQPACVPTLPVDPRATKTAIGR